jgi:hypothetical protein
MHTNSWGNCIPELDIFEPQSSEPPSTTTDISEALSHSYGCRRVGLVPEPQLQVLLVSRGPEKFCSQTSSYPSPAIAGGTDGPVASARLHFITAAKP